MKAESKLFSSGSERGIYLFHFEQGAEWTKNIPE